MFWLFGQLVGVVVAVMGIGIGITGVRAIGKGIGGLTESIIDAKSNNLNERKKNHSRILRAKHIEKIRQHLKRKKELGGCQPKNYYLLLFTIMFFILISICIYIIDPKQLLPSLIFIFFFLICPGAHLIISEHREARAHKKIRKIIFCYKEERINYYKKFGYFTGFDNFIASKKRKKYE